MNLTKNDTDIYLILGSAILLLTGLTGFIIYFLVLYRKKQVLHLIEREKQALQFHQEMLNTQIEIQEQTMQTIGTDLHDNIGQLLSLTSLTLNSINITNDVKAQAKIESAIGLTLKSIKELRQLGKLLQGDQLIAMGLVEAIRHEVEWIERSGKYQVHYSNEGEFPAEWNKDKDLVIFRILQETLNNIIRHSSASQIDIKLSYLDNVVLLNISDNGVGFDATTNPAVKHGMGLHNIHKRAAIIGGELAINSSPDQGTTITIIVPYP